jgi:hypothetical protein
MMNTKEATIIGSECIPPLTVGIRRYGSTLFFDSYYCNQLKLSKIIIPLRRPIGHAHPQIRSCIQRLHDRKYKG